MTTILPLLDLSFDQSKVIWWSQGKKKIEHCAFVYVNKPVKDNTSKNDIDTYKNTITRFNYFSLTMRLTFGENSADYGMAPRPSLNYFLFASIWPDLPCLDMMIKRRTIRRAT